MNRKRLISTGLVVLTLAIGSSLTAFATSGSNSTSVGEVQTQEQRQNKVQLTEAQRTAIENARKTSLKEAAAAMLSNGTITQTEYETLISNLDKIQEKPVNPGKIKGQGRENEMFSNLTEPQKEAIKTESQTVYENSLAKLVSEKTITQEQADQLKIMQGKKAKLDLTETQRNAIKEAKMNSIKTAVANLTSNGTLTQEQSDAITASIANRPTDAPKGNGIFGDLTDTQISAIKDAASASYKTALANLVSDGTITQEIADKVQNMIMGHGPNGKGHGQRNINETETSAASV